jgi:N-acetylglucosamine kinase-like BadF-type ATPase
MSRTLVVGLDSGGTATRCVVATLDGRIVGRGLAGGANQRSSGGHPADTLGTALSAALSTVDLTAVRLGVFGAAGAGAAGRAAFAAAAEQAWRRAGLTGDIVTVTDLEVGFAAGTAARDGALLVAGTGAAAVRFADGVPVRRCDGYGWLLGDEGSAVWIGVRALRAALAALDGRGEPTALVAAVCAGLGVEPPPRVVATQREDVAQALIAAAHAGTPASHGRLAPAVGAAADAGDAVARRITDAAAARLLRALATVEPAAGAPIVFVGSVLLSPGPVARAVRAGVVERFGAEPVPAADGAGGAATIAIARLRGGPVPATVHTRLTAPPPRIGADRPHEPSRE